jgi:hypothetical protein
LDIPFLARQRPVEALTYEAFMELTAEQAAAAPPPGDVEAAERIEFTKLNLHRSQRIARTWQPSGELASLLQIITEPEQWLVLTEPWCGDSAQCLPCVAVMAEHQPNIALHVLPRDVNLDIMDQFLTDGKRSIPVVVMFDASGREVGRWGPRPAEAQAVFEAAKAEGLEKPGILERLHLWYGRNRGAALDAEFCTLLKRRMGGA